MLVRSARRRRDFARALQTLYALPTAHIREGVLDFIIVHDTIRFNAAFS